MVPNINSDVPLSILEEILRIKRQYPDYKTRLDALDQLEQVKAIQLPRIRAFVKANQPVEFILPAFPTKSPNLNKVLGYLPDMAERISLRFLNELCQRIKRWYEPGAKLTICSDGRVFGDQIRTTDEKISAYKQGVQHLISELDAKYLGLFNLEDFKPFSDCTFCFDNIRQQLVDQFAEPIEIVKQKLAIEEGGMQLYCAITRFMFEDGLIPGYSGSKSMLQKDAKKRALSVIQLSRAWGALLDYQFPDAIRLSIHPQPASSLKVGIHMMPTMDCWLTPWHGVAVEVEGKFVLMKRSEAESIGGRIVMRDQQQSHYEIDLSQLSNQRDLKMMEVL